MSMKPYQKKLVGFAMMIPLTAIAISLLLNKSMWVYLLCGLVSMYLFNCGLKIVKGASFSDIKNKVVKDIDGAKSDAQKKYDQAVKKK